MIRDVAIVGGGPAGCRLAKHLSKDHSVVIIEEHGEIGKPVQCGGLASPRAVCGITRESVKLEIRNFILHPPKGDDLVLHANKPKGIVIDRGLYDRLLADAAVDLGAQTMLGTRVVAVKSHNDFVEILCRSEDERKSVRARLVVGADGPRSLIRKSVTDKGFELVYKGAQYEGGSDSNDNAVEMWVGRKIAPDFFAWKIPTNDSLRIGLCTQYPDSPIPYLKEFVEQKFPALDITSRHGGLIPMETNGPLANGRFSILGDAAGQTKPLTGGGIYLGKRAAEILADAIDKEGVDPSALSLYERRFHAEFEKEITRAWRIRKVINRLSDSKMNKAIRILSDSKVMSLFEESGDIDYPSGLSPQVLKLAPKLMRFAPDVLKSMIIPG